MTNVAPGANAKPCSLFGRAGAHAWAVLGALIWLVARPAYKVLLTECGPPEEVRAAVAINSTTKTGSMVRAFSEQRDAQPRTASRVSVDQTGKPQPQKS